MKKSHILVLVFILLAWTNPKAPTTLFPYKQGESWGYMDANGTVIIQPIFKTVMPYSEGLAAVREDGYYGYIDTEGKLQIAYKFDYAESFHNGTARVFIGSKPYIINKKGKILFEHSYKTIGLFDEANNCLVLTRGDHCGLVDKSGKLIVDTLYKSMEALKEGIYIVTGLKHDPYADKGEKYEVGLINRKGELLIPFGKFTHIEKFNEGIASARVIKEIKTKSGEKTDEVFIDVAGNILFVVDLELFGFDEDKDEFHQQLCPVNIPMKRKIPGSSNRDFYAGVLNTRGQVVFSDSTWEEVSYFSSNRAFVKLKTGGWRMINRQGKLVGKDVYDEVIPLNEQSRNQELLFKDNRCWVLGGKEVSAIDTNGNTLVKLPAVNFNFDDICQHGEWLAFKEDVSYKDEDFTYLYGLYNSKTGRLIKPSFGDISMNEPEAPLQYVQTRKSWGYINQQGKMIWEENQVDEDSLAQLNIDFMTRGYFYASSPYREGHEGFGGWGGSANEVREIKDKKLFNKDHLEIVLDDSQQTEWRSHYKGIKAYVANGTADTVVFEAQDSRLYIKMQALDKNGEWRNIEYLPNSWCGNSYHRLHLASGQYWEFDVPIYQGEFKTKLRLELVCNRDAKEKGQKIYYSNSIDGSINPGQFWRKKEYTPGGLMDPYLE